MDDIPKKTEAIGSRDEKGRFVNCPGPGRKTNLDKLKLAVGGEEEINKKIKELWEAGDKTLIQYIIERVFDKPKQAIDVGGQEDNPLLVQDVFKFKIVRPDDTNK